MTAVRPGIRRPGRTAPTPGGKLAITKAVPDAMDALTKPGDTVGALTLRDVDGDPVALDDLLERPLAVPLVRYYGCMPCRDFLIQLEAARPALEAAGVGRGAE